MFTRERAVKFLTEVLDLPNPEQLLRGDRLEALSVIFESYLEHIPFQCLTLMAESPSNRRRPTIEESIAEVETGKGGLCYSINVFLKVLLDALGYSTYHTKGLCMGVATHCIVVAKDVVVPGDKYLVDAGTGFPATITALDFEKESQVYEDCFLKYKFVWEDGILKRSHLRGERQGECRWETFCTSDMVPKDLSDFEAGMSQVYTEPDRTPFHTSMRAIGFPNKKAVCICDMKLLKEDDSHKMQETKLSSKEEFLDTVRKYFPLLVEDAKKALTNWTPVEEPESVESALLL